MNDELDPDERFSAIIATADPRDAKLWAILELLEDVVRTPAHARLAGDRVEVTHIEYGGDEVQGLIATVCDEHGARSLPLSDIMLLSREPGAEVVRRYGDWIRGRAVDAVARDGAMTAPPVSDGPVRLVILAVMGRTARARRLDDGSDVVFRPKDREAVVPGTLITLRPKASVTGGLPGTRAGDDLPPSGVLLEGEIESVAIDATQLGIVPSPLVVDEDGVNHELTAPGDTDLLDEADLLADGGDPQGARRLLLGLLAEEPGRLDAHQRLGDIALPSEPRLALTHYAVGAAIGDLAVPEPLDGLLPGERPNNRPYLACLYGCGRALHRLGRDGDAIAPLRRLLALDPDDHFGARQLLLAVGGRSSLDD